MRNRMDSLAVLSVLLLPLVAARTLAETQRAPTTQPSDPGQAVKIALREANGLPNATPQVKAKYLASWVARNEVWKKAAPRDLAAMIWVLRQGKCDDARRQARNVAGAVWHTYFGSDARLSGLSVTDSTHLIIYAHPLLSKEQKAELGERAVGRFSHKGVVSRLTPYLLNRVRLALRVLGRATSAADIAVAWMSANEKWHALKVRELAILANCLRAGSSEGCIRQRKAVVETAWRLYLGPETDPDALDKPEVRALANAVLSGLTDVQRGHLAERMGARIGPASGLSKLKFADVREHVIRLKRFGPAHTAELVANWMIAGEAWKQARPTQLLYLLGELKSSDSGVVKSQRTGLAQHMYSTYLGANATGKATAAELLEMTLRVLPLLPKERKAELAESLPDRLMASDLRAKMPVEGLGLVWAILRDLGNPAGAARVAAAWMARNEWMSLKPKQLSVMAATLQSARPADVAEQTTALVRHVWQMYLGPEAGVTLASPDIQGLALAIGPLLSKAQRAELAGRFGRAYAAQDRASLAKLTLAESLNRTALLAADLRGEAVAAWTAATDAWKKATVPELMGLLARLSAGESQAVVRQRSAVVAFLQERYVAARSSKLGTSDLLQLAHALPPLLDGPQKTQLLARLEGHFTNAGTVAKMSLPQIGAAATGFHMLGKRGLVPDIAATWMAANDDWRSLDPQGLLALTVHLGTGKSRQVARQRAQLVRHVEAKVLTNPKTIRGAGLATVRDLSRHVAAHLSDRQRVAWAGKIRRAFARSPDALDEMQPPQLKKLHTALAALAPAEAVAVLTDLVGQGSRWRSWQPKDIYWLTTSLSVGKDPRAAEGRRRVLDLVTAKVIPDPTAVKSLHLGDWRSLTYTARKDLTQAERVQWVNALNSAFGDDASSAGMATARGLALLSVAIMSLEGANSQKPRELAVRVVTGSDAWKAWEPVELIRLAGRLARAGDNGKAARQRLGEHVVNKYVVAPAAARSIALKQWHRFFTVTVEDLPPEIRRLAAEKLRDAFAGPGRMALLAVEAKQFEQIVGVIDLLDAKLAGDMVTARARDKRTLSTASIADLVSLAAMTAAKNKFAAAPILDRLDHLYRTAPARFTWRDCAAVSRTWHTLANQTRSHDWARRASGVLVGTEQARAAVTEAELLELSRFYREVGMLGKGKGYPDFAKAVASLARQGKLPASDNHWYHAVALGWPLATPASGQILQGDLLGADGELRLPPAQILSWAYLICGDQAEWHAFLDRKLAEPTLRGDKRARWLLVRGYAASLRGPHMDPSPISGKGWLVQAVDAAESPFVRITAIKQLALGYEVAHKYAEGAKFLDSAASKFTHQQVKAAIKSVHTQLIQGEVQYLRHQIANARTFAAKMDLLAAQADDEKSRRFYLKWAGHDRERERELLGRLEQLVTLHPSATDCTGSGGRRPVAV